MRAVRWKGSDPPSSNKSVCPFSIHFESKPIPSDKLDSMEAGKLALAVSLRDSDLVVDSVVVEIVNNAKRSNLGKVKGSSNIKRSTVISASLKGSKNAWEGEIGIPVTWMEGGTRTYEKTGSSTPRAERRDLFTMSITYSLNENSCSAEFTSSDVFHWQPRTEARI